ncbi:alpha-L-fucosidase [Bacteroides sp. 51]|uniref:alpha-L-fucosidase n=1 Tax=Bacteroides sp. 51 TaxID=2302938 RepID=UPI0013D2EE37|nr:alpha-L-fucosidase [Bacteroides sp. 51]NDV84212.1 alpha-L-fucosidase [Bacteroides sp. 51]
MNKVTLKTWLLSVVLTGALAAPAHAQRVEPAAQGKFAPTWESLSAYQTPEWFRNAKFGIWAHWGPQCQPEAGDWYGRAMYEEGGDAYKVHLEKYGHPSEFGFKDVINEWKAENWDPEKLVALYKRTGAQYFFAMGNHHDNMDLWDSKYQRWNSVNMGPRRDILAEWERAARKHKLPYGVSIHSSHAWTWYGTAQGADKTGPYAGISYDARVVRKEDGKGKWWEGYDPEELYVQNHSLSGHAWGAWDWPEGTSVPTQAYYDNFFDRTVDMINRYNPDLVYFDDSVLPFFPIDNTGLDVVAHYYNQNMKRNKGKLNAVVFGKKLQDQHKEALVWDVEKGVPSTLQDKAWQTCSCLGTWHYNRSTYVDNWYKSGKMVIHMLVDIVSKNGNLLLSVPMKGDGTIDDKEERILEDIAAWMDVNKEGIFDTRPWRIFGEGPSAETEIPLDGAGFNEGKNKPYTAADIRFVENGKTLYAHVMEWPADGKVLIKSLASDSPYHSGKIKKVELLGAGKADFQRTKNGLLVSLPKGGKPNEISLVLKIN